MTERLVAAPPATGRALTSRALTSRALVLSAWGGEPELVEYPVPTASAGQTLVRVHAAAVAHLDLALLSGGFAQTARLPLVPGTEGAGVVVESAAHPVGTAVRVRGGGVGLARDGSWAEHVLVPDTAVLTVPDGTDPALACSAFSPAASAHAALHDVAHLEPGETVLVTGAAGAVGSLVVQLAVRAGATVVALVSRESKRGLVPAAADEVLVGDELLTRWPGAAEPGAGRSGAGGAGTVGPGGVDLLVDTVGGPALPRALAAVVPGGRAVLVGYTAGRALPLDLQSLMQADVALLPLNLLRRGPGLVGVFDGLLAELSSGALVLPVERYPLAEAPAALARLRSGEALGKVVLVLDP